MEQISRDIATFLEGHDGIQDARTVEEVRKGGGYAIENYRQLVERVAVLSFHNPEFVLFYRGQRQDFRSLDNLSLLYPSIFRANGPLTGK